MSLIRRSYFRIYTIFFLSTACKHCKHIMRLPNQMLFEMGILPHTADDVLLKKRRFWIVKQWWREIEVEGGFLLLSQSGWTGAVIFRNVFVVPEFSKIV